MQQHGYVYHDTYQHFAEKYSCLHPSKSIGLKVFLNEGSKYKSVCETILANCVEKKWGGWEHLETMVFGQRMIYYDSYTFKVLETLKKDLEIHSITILQS